jgi:ABC-2 type transport system permease protein
MERGTVQLALARPVSRTQLYLSRTFGVLVISVVLAAVGPLGLIAGYRWAQPVGEFSISHLVPMAFGSLALFLAIGGLALLGSAAASSAGRVLGWGLAVFVLMYFVDYFAGIWSFLKPVEFLSLFDYYDPTTSLVVGSVDSQNLLVLGLVGLAGWAAGLAVFANRDFPT